MTLSEAPSDLTAARGQDITNRVIVACAFILIGLVLLADSLRILPSARGTGSGEWIALGIGMLLLVGEALRAVFASGSRPSTGRMILGTAAAGYGAGAIFDISTSVLLPSGLIVLGVLLLLRNLFAR